MEGEGLRAKFLASDAPSQGETTPHLSSGGSPAGSLKGQRHCNSFVRCTMELT